LASISREVLNDSMLYITKQVPSNRVKGAVDVHQNLLKREDIFKGSIDWGPIKYGFLQDGA
jgi:hypothetical protein